MFMKTVFFPRKHDLANKSKIWCWREKRVRI